MARRHASIWVRIFTTFELIFAQAVYNVRKSHGNAIVGLLLNIAQTMLLVAVFMAIFTFTGMGGAGIRGDVLLFLMTGIFMFMAHVKVIAAVSGAEGPTSAIMKHGPMNPIIAICGAAMAEMYIQVLSMLVILFLYHAIWTPLTIYQPVQAFAMYISVWFAGFAIGVLVYALKPWMPQGSKLFTMFYTRLNMVASGKFTLANALPTYMLPYFTWNPLFHGIDQARGYAFINYNPLHTWALYPLLFAMAVLVIGMLGEFYTRNRVSLSWSAKL
jgi:ABC-type polysaccharide/polyol phosphate export permease